MVEETILTGNYISLPQTVGLRILQKRSGTHTHIHIHMILNPGISSHRYFLKMLHEAHDFCAATLSTIDFSGSWRNDCGLVT